MKLSFAITYGGICIQQLGHQRHNFNVILDQIRLPPEDELAIGKPCSKHASNTLYDITG